MVTIEYFPTQPHMGVCYDNMKWMEIIYSHLYIYF